MPGRIAAIVVAVLVLLPVAVVWSHAGEAWAFRWQDWSVLRFTLAQAGTSAMLSTVLAVPLARALFRSRFPGRRLLVLVMGAPFILPVIVAVFGLIEVFGRSGLMNRLLEAWGGKKVSVYGFWGVVLANVFFNLPFVTRLVLLGWAEIPGERFRLASSLGMGQREVGRFLERPMLREVLPGAVAAVFLICLSSFAVALTMGGGPRATTLELAIYQAFRFDFDMSRAATLAALQMAICLAAAIISLRFTAPTGFGTGLDRALGDWIAVRHLSRVADAALIVVAAAFLLLPLGVVVADGLAQVPRLPAPVWLSALRSITVALLAAALCVAMALMIAVSAAGVRRRAEGWAEVAGMLPMASSALVFGTGMFLLLRGLASPAAIAMPMTVAANALAALPFVLRILVPAARRVEADFGRLSSSLGMTGANKLRYLILPRLWRPLGFAAGLSAALSMGDLGVVALFADPEKATLPLTMYRLMGAYRMEEAAGAAVLLLGLSLLMFWLFDVWGHRGTDA